MLCSLIDSFHWLLSGFGNFSSPLRSDNDTTPRGGDASFVSMTGGVGARRPKAAVIPTEVEESPVGCVRAHSNERARLRLAQHPAPSTQRPGGYPTRPASVRNDGGCWASVSSAGGTSRC